MPKPHVYSLLGVVPPGTVVGYWTVINEARPKHGIRHLLCRCDCGKERDVSIGALRTGASSSCGCHTNKRTHGLSHTKESMVWRMMIQRCHNPNNDAFQNYGGRGIQVCQRWRDSFQSFLDDMGRRPSPEMTLDRINNDGNYEPGNVRWATRRDQLKNTRLTYADRVRNGQLSAMKRWHPEQYALLTGKSL